MTAKEIIGKIENLLFASGESMPITGIAALLEEDEARINEVLEEEMAARESGYGLVIKRFGDRIQLATRAECGELLYTAFGRRGEEELTRAMLETLAIIAYKQPMTRAQVEEIRGVNSDHAVTKLLEKRLICEVGRADTPGKPILFGTSKEFLRYFGFKSIRELPPLEEENPEEAKEKDAETEFHT